MPQGVAACDDYLKARTGKYEYRRIRYNAAADAMRKSGGLNGTDTLIDVGAGWTELDYCLRAEHNWRGRYIPVDGSIDGVDLEKWVPPRAAEWFVALEILEHLSEPGRLVFEMQKRAAKGIVVSTPNPMTTDVLGMDPDHKTAVPTEWLRNWGFVTALRPFYGAEADSIFGVWLA